MKNLNQYSTLLVLFALTANAQTGGSFDLSNSVIASGGGSNSNGSSGGTTFRVDGTIGQAIAGVTSSGAGFSVTGGFWQPEPLLPTAAGVSIAGRVLRADGSPVYRARVGFLDASGVLRSAVTNQFGRFRLEDLEPGQSYIIDVRHRVIRFAPAILTPTQNVGDLVLSEIP